MKEKRISIPQGILKGNEYEGYCEFLNVPYASDRGRFREAGEAPSWSGIRDASSPGPVFPQSSGRLAFVMGNTEEENYQSESAFSVNIWTPADALKTKILVEDGRTAKCGAPVLFWMHGGAFMTGGGAIPWYSGAMLAEKAGIVVVNVSYRLGVLGNLYCPELSDVNLSVKDVNRALRWVHENIQYFGGDPENITAAGQSAGAWYTVLMMGNPALKGLFRRAGLFSFNGGTAPYLPAEAEKMTSKLMTGLGLKDSADLMGLDSEKILAAQKIAVNQPERLNIPFLPVIDDETVFPDYIRQSALVSDPAVEIFCGTVAHESTPFVSPDPKEKEHDYLRRVAQNTRAAFTNDTDLLLRYMLNAGHSVYRYEFDYESMMPHIHSCHCFDIPFLFRNFDYWKGAPFLQNLNREEAERVSDAYSSAFVHFMKYGTPGESWKPYDETETTIRRFR